MHDYTLGPVESRFAELIWAREPIRAGELAALCQQELSWKRTTTYTVLKRLEQKGLFQNRGGVVTSLISRQEFYSLQSRRFVQDAFSGSLPKFLTAFCSRQKLTSEEIQELERLIEQSKGEEP